MCYFLSQQEPTTMFEGPSSTRKHTVECLTKAKSFVENIYQTQSHIWHVRLWRVFVLCYLQTANIYCVYARWRARRRGLAQPEVGQSLVYTVTSATSRGPNHSYHHQASSHPPIQLLRFMRCTTAQLHGWIICGLVWSPSIPAWSTSSPLLCV